MPSEQEIDFIKKYNDTMIKIIFDGLAMTYFIDNVRISKEEMEDMLENFKNNKKSPKL